jgi:RNA polymerase sigma factor (sigma-70 family)
MHPHLTMPTLLTGHPAAEHTPTASAPAQDRVAFSILVRQHHRDFLAYARSLLRDQSAAADLVQEALLVAFRNLARFDTTASFPAWVRGIIRNKWRELARQRSWETLSDEVLQDIEAQHASWQHAAAQAHESNPVFTKLEDCLRQLPDKLREAVHACYFQTHNSEEAAATLGANASSVRKRLERARSALRLCIESPAQA